MTEHSPILEAANTDDEVEALQYATDGDEEAEELDKEFVIEEVLADVGVSGDGARDYLNKIGRIPLLTREQEVEYGRAIQAGKDAAAKYQSGAQLSAKEHELYQAHLHARDRLAEANLRWVVTLARRNIRRGLEFLDLIQWGNLGLLKAVDKFDPELGYKFSTYSIWWIRREIGVGIMDGARNIRLPMHILRRAGKIVAAQRELEDELNRSPSLEELAAKLPDFSLELIAETLIHTRDTYSINVPVQDNEGGQESELGDLHPDPRMDVVQEGIEPIKWRALHAKLAEVIAQYKPDSAKTERYRRAVELRLGMARYGETWDAEIATYQEVGEALGVTRERARQMCTAIFALIKDDEEMKDLLR